MYPGTGCQGGLKPRRHGEHRGKTGDKRLETADGGGAEDTEKNGGGTSNAQRPTSNFEQGAEGERPTLNVQLRTSNKGAEGRREPVDGRLQTTGRIGE